MDTQQSELPRTFPARAEHNLLACGASAEAARHAQSHKTTGPQHAFTSGRSCVHSGLCRNQLVNGAQSDEQLGSGLSTVLAVCYTILVSICEDAASRPPGLRLGQAVDVTRQCRALIRECKGVINISGSICL